MKFYVFPFTWGPGGIEPLEVLKKYVASPVKENELPRDKFHPEKRNFDYEVEITPEELMTMAQAKEFDILISGNGYMAFDGRGRGFRQR